MINLVVTEGKGSLDLYSQRLAEHVDANIVRCKIYQVISESFNAPWLSIRSLRAIWSDYNFIRQLRRLDGIIHLPNHHLGRHGYFLDKPFIITVHDLMRFFDLKEVKICDGVLIDKPNSRDRYYLSLDYKGVQKAARIIATSKHTKMDLVKYLNIPPHKIDVVYSGIEHEIFRPMKASPPIDEPYILYVGSEQPRKNLASLLAALKILKGDNRFKDLKLVKIGRAGGRGSYFRSLTMSLIRRLGLERDVIFRGFIPSRELARYYAAAMCYVLPSLYEGFGFTPLEAMACGCPVVASNAAAIPEVVGDAALLVDPKRPGDIANSIKRLILDDELRQELKDRGMRRAKMFSWEKTGSEVMAIYKRLEEVYELGKKAKLAQPLETNGLPSM